MKKIKDLISKPSDALQAMVDGLLEADKRKDFRIDMDTFGDAEGKVCIGCAATCAVMKLVDFKITPKNIYLISITDDSEKGYLGWDTSDIWYFEVAINAARMGSLETLFKYFGIPSFNLPSELIVPHFYITTDSWMEYIPVVTEHIKKLQAAGF